MTSLSTDEAASALQHQLGAGPLGLVSMKPMAAGELDTNTPTVTLKVDLNSLDRVRDRVNNPRLAFRRNAKSVGARARYRVEQRIHSPNGRSRRDARYEFSKIQTKAQQSLTKQLDNIPKEKKVPISLANLAEKKIENIVMTAALQGMVLPVGLRIPAALPRKHYASLKVDPSMMPKDMAPDAPQDDMELAQAQPVPRRTPSPRVSRSPAEAKNRWRHTPSMMLG